MRMPFFAALMLLVIVAPRTVQGESLQQVAAQVDSLEVLLESVRGVVERIQAQLDSLQAGGAADADSTEGAESVEPEVISLNENVGIEIDAEERERFGLFVNIAGFRSATYLKYPDGRYVVVITQVDEEGNEAVLNNNVSLAGIEFVRAKMRSAAE